MRRRRLRCRLWHADASRMKPKWRHQIQMKTVFKLNEDTDEYCLQIQNEYTWEQKWRHPFQTQKKQVFRLSDSKFHLVDLIAQFRQPVSFYRRYSKKRCVQNKKQWSKALKSLNNSHIIRSGNEDREGFILSVWTECRKPKSSRFWSAPWRSIIPVYTWIFAVLSTSAFRHFVRCW